MAAPMSVTTGWATMGYTTMRDSTREVSETLLRGVCVNHLLGSSAGRVCRTDW